MTSKCRNADQIERQFAGERAGGSDQETATRGRHEEIIKASEGKTRRKGRGMEKGSDKKR